MPAVTLAEWIASPKNPLTARVFVNRVWHSHFGRGLVATPNNLGLAGARPTHPELLDWLASKFVHDVWLVKKLHRLIVTSATYRQASANHDVRDKIDEQSAKPKATFANRKTRPPMSATRCFPSRACAD